ncbi:LOW QUALITY PROTEIN: meiosis inhibitor protein 1 [Pelodytes ibericus]
MATVHLYERVHYRHDSCWLLSGPDSEAFCLACVIEMVEDETVAVVRKKHVLSIFQKILKVRTSNVTELLANDGRICTHFIETMLGMLLNMEDESALALVTEILVQLIVLLASDHYSHCVLKECHKEALIVRPAGVRHDKPSNSSRGFSSTQKKYTRNSVSATAIMRKKILLSLLEAPSMKATIPVFNFLGKLVDAIPSLADIFATEHCNLVEYMPQGLMYPNEAMKAAICYLYGKLYSSPTAAETLSVHFADKLCGLFLATLESAQTKELQINCMGLLKQVLKSDHFVTVIMNESGYLSDSESTPTLQAQNPLPLVLKKVLSTREEILQIATTQCITAILVHSPTKYAPAFIHSDTPEFLFEHLSSRNEVLIWSVYCCLLLMTEERLLFSKCHTAYGIEAVVRSLKDVVRMNNMELLKQGLLLLQEILQRQPMEVKLFTNPGIFKATADVLLESVNCPVLEVVIGATRCASAFLRWDHLTTPVLYGELQNLISKIFERLADFPLHPMIRKQVGKSSKKDQIRNITRQGHLLTSTLQTFQNACRLALECQNDPTAQENPFTAPTSESDDTLEKFSRFLLEICDSICIPTVMKYYERSPVPQAMEIYFSVLCDIFAVVPSMKTTFSMKLASASFIRLSMEVKSMLCSGHRNPNLNQTCSTFLSSLCSTLWAAAVDYVFLSEISDVLQKSVIHLNGTTAENLSLLLETANGPHALRCQQHSLLIIFCVAFINKDKFIPEADLLWAVLAFLHSVQCQGDQISSYVIRASIYLLAVCQDRCEELNTTSVNMICGILEDIPDFQILYFHHPLYLKFFFRYPQLRQNFGCKIAQLWITYEDCSEMCEEDKSAQDCNMGGLKKQCSCLYFLNILHSDPNSILVLLDLIITGPVEMSYKVLLILKTFLKENNNSFISDLLSSRLLQVLQSILIRSSGVDLQADTNLPLILSLLYLVQRKSHPEHVMENINFKLLYHVSNISGKCSPFSVNVLQPAFNFLYCSLHQASVSCQMRASAMLLSNISLIELIESILQVTLDNTSTSSNDRSETLCCLACLITSSLVCFQQKYNLEVHRSLCVDVDKLLYLLSFRSKKKSDMLIVSLIQLLKVLLRQRFSSSLLIVRHSESRNESQTEHKSALHPLTTESVLYLLAALQNLLIQKNSLIVQATISGLESLLDFVFVKDIHVGSSGTKLLQSEFLRFLTMLLKYEITNILMVNEIQQIIDEASKLMSSELPTAAVLDLQIFLQQHHNFHTPMFPTHLLILASKNFLRSP